MPRLNRAGDLWCAGIAGDGFYGGDFDGDRPRLIAELHPAGMRAFLNDEEAVTQVGDREVRAVDCRTSVERTVAAHGAGEVFAGGGVWASFLAGHGVRTSTGLQLPDAYVGAGTGPLRNDCVGPDGSIAIKAQYHSAGPWHVYSPAGTRWLLSPHEAANIQLLGGLRAIYRVGWDWHATGGAPVPRPLFARAWHLKLLELPDGPWLVYQAEDDEHGRVIAHPNGDTRGYLLGHARDAFGLDAVPLADGRIRVIWATSEGEHPSSLVTATFRTTDARVSLTTPAPQPNPAPEPKPTPEDPVFDDRAARELIARIARELDAQQPTLRSTNLERYQAIVARRCWEVNKHVGRKSNHGAQVGISKAALGIRYDLSADTSARVLMTAVDYVRDETTVGPDEWWDRTNRNPLRPEALIHRNERQYWIEPAAVEGGDEDDPGDSDQPGPGPVEDPALLPIVQELSAAALQVDVAAVRLGESIAALRAVKRVPTPAPHECPTPRWPDDHECPPLDLSLPYSEPMVQDLRAAWEAAWRGPLPGDLLTFLLFRLMAEHESEDALLEEVQRRRG